MMDITSSQRGKELNSTPNVESNGSSNANTTTEEEKVNQYFYKLYLSQISTDEMIKVMHNLSSSAIGSSDFNVYDTMLKVLFNECKFFPKYPVQELVITAELFGKMIKSGLLVNNARLLQLALRCVLEALKRGKSSKMFQFGTIALSQIENSIASYPLFSTQLLTIPEVRETFPQLYRTCEKLQTIMSEQMINALYVDQTLGLVIRPVDESNSEQNVRSVQQSVAKEQQSAVQIEEYDCLAVGELEKLMNGVESDFKIVVPADSISCQIYAIFNNMNMATLSQMAQQVSQLLKGDNNAWLLLYIIRIRASREHNLHEVFVSFIEELKTPKLFDLAIQITFACISACLKHLSELKETSAYRTLLKNLGAWLGRITLGRNLPIVSRFMDVKRLLLSAYEEGSLVAILPFVAKIMEGMADSRIFRPPNPWTDAILAAMVEIQRLPNLKTNLVFEVEVLFKKTRVEITDYIGRTKLLVNKIHPSDSPDFDLSSIQHQKASHNSSVPISVAGRGSKSPTKGTHRLNDLHNRVTTPSTRNGSLKAKFPAYPTTIQQTQIESMLPTPEFIGKMLQQQQQQIVNVPTNFTLSTQGEALLEKLPQQIIISPSIALFELQPNLKCVVPEAMSDAIRKVLPVIFDHVISIVKNACRVLVPMDFSTENDESVVKSAICLFFTHFSMSLVMATSREPLRVNMHESLRTSLQTQCNQDNSDLVLIEQLVQILIQDNLNVAISTTEKIVAERIKQESNLFATELINNHVTKATANVFLPPLLQKYNLRMSREKLNLSVYKKLFQQYSKTSMGDTSTDLYIVRMGETAQILTQTALQAAAQPTNLHEITPSSTVSAPPSLSFTLTVSIFEEVFADLKDPLRDIALFPPTLYSMGPHEQGYENMIFSTHPLLVLYSLPVDHHLFFCIACCVSVLETSPFRDQACVVIAYRLLMFLCDGVSSHAGLNVEVLLCVLDELSHLNPMVKTAISNVIFSLPLNTSNNIFNVITITGLLRYRLLDWNHLTHYLTQAMDRGNNSFAVEMAIAVVAIALIDQRSAPFEVGATLIREIAGVSCQAAVCRTYPYMTLKDAQARLLRDFMELSQPTCQIVTCLTPLVRRNVAQVISARDLNPVGGAVDLVKLRKLGFGGVRRVPPPPAVSESQRAIVAILFAKWVECSLSFEGEPLLVAWRQFFQRFSLKGLFKMEGGTDNFFAICVHCAISTLPSELTKPSTAILDENVIIQEKLDSFVALAKMADVMLRLVSGSDVPPSSALQKLLAATASLIVYEDNYIGCYKLWVVLCYYFHKVEQGNTNLLCKITFLHALQSINPIRMPNFAKYWFMLLGSRFLTPDYGNQKCWFLLSKLYTLSAFYVDSIPDSPICLDYIQLISNISESHPEFVMENYCIFGANLIVERCVCATSTASVLPPHLQNVLKLPQSVDLLPEMRHIPKLSFPMVHYIIKDGIKLQVEESLRNLSKILNPSGITRELVEALERQRVENSPQAMLIYQALVLYIGVGAVSKHSEPVHPNVRCFLFINLLRALDIPGKHLLTRAIIRQLRYPNAHTLFYACLILWMIDELKPQRDDINRQVLLRVLIENFVAPQPCAWGIKLVVVELFRNPRFDILNACQSASLRVQSLFESIAQLCAE